MTLKLLNLIELKNFETKLSVGKQSFSDFIGSVLFVFDNCHTDVFEHFGQTLKFCRKFNFEQKISYKL